MALAITFGSTIGPAGARLVTATPAAAAVGSFPALTAPEVEALGAVNRARAGAGLAPLVSDGLLAATARGWSVTMADRGALSHDPALAEVAAWVEPAWTKVAENVGLGGTVASVQDAFMGSPGHRGNILDPAVNRIGVGVEVRAGRVWVTLRFLAGPAITGITGLETPAPTTPVATFVPAVTATTLTGDFDGDGVEDAFVYGPGTAADEVWWGRPDGRFVRGVARVDGRYVPVAGDFDADGRTEILWYGPGSSQDRRWDWNGVGWQNATVSVSGTYRPVPGDFDGDGAADVLWYGPGTAGDRVWYGGSAGFTSIPVRVDGNYQPVAGDFDGDGHGDVLWYGPGTARDRVAYGAGRGGFDVTVITVNGTYRPFGADLDGNGTSDVFWYAPGGAGDPVWFMSTRRGERSYGDRTVNGDYAPAAGDFDRNGLDDVLWYSPSSAQGDPIWWTQPDRSLTQARVSG